MGHNLNDVVDFILFAFSSSVNTRQKALLEEFSQEEEILEREGYEETKWLVLLISFHGVRDPLYFSFSKKLNLNKYKLSLWHRILQ